MNELLTELLQAVITVTVPIVSAFLVNLIRLKSAQAKAKTQSSLMEAYIEEAEKAVVTAVLCIEQTYVDIMKKDNKWNTANQIEALKKSLDMAKSQITADARDFLEMAYGDINTYLLSKIEAEIKLEEIERQ